MQGPKKMPYASIRRDDRAEPDDEANPHSTPRIDVVNVDGPGTGQGIPSPVPSAPRSEVANGITSLRAQLKSLNDQAAAVERSLDEQRRERSEALDRLERATERCISLETTISTLEAESKELRHENENLHGTLEESMRAAATFEGELTDVRKRQLEEALKVTDLEGEVALLKKQLEAASGDIKKAQSELEKASREALSAREEATQARDAAAKARDENAKLKEERDRADVRAKQELEKAKQDLAMTKLDAGRTKTELDRAKEDNVKDRATARDRIDLLERALDDARAQSSRTETALEQSRENEDTMGRQLEAAMERAADAKTRAEVAQASQHTLEQNVRRLREAISKSFAKIGHGADKPPVPRSSIPVAANDQEPESLSSDLIDSVPPSARSKPPPPGVYSAIGASMPPLRPFTTTSVAPTTISGVPPIPSMSKPPPPPPSGSPVVGPPLELDSDWASPDSVPPAASSSVRPSAASPASKSVPPPLGVLEAPVMNGVGKHDSIPPPTYASVPPQIHAVAYEGPLDDGDDEEPTRPEANVGPRESTAPETKRGGMSSIPVPSLPHNTQASTPPSALSRDELLARLMDPMRAATAAAELKQHPDWLTSVPPPALVHALQTVDYDADRPVFDLARQWEREPLCHALIASLRGEPEARLREHAAWLLKHLAAPSSWKAIADLARSEDEGIQLRRWLLEALDRLAAGRGIGWRELGDVVTLMSKHSDASLRDGVVGILVALDRSDEKRRLLLDILRADDDEVVLASAVDALAGALPVELDPNLVERLLGHPSARVQRSVRDLIERAKRN